MIFSDPFSSGVLVAGSGTSTIRLRPGLVFGAHHAARLLTTMEEVARELASAEGLINDRKHVISELPQLPLRHGSAFS